MRLLIIDDHILFREGLVSLLKMQPDFEIVGEGGSVQEAISMAKELRPEIILLDVGLPDGTGIEAARAILESQTEIKIIFLTMHENETFLFEAVRAGAKGYLLKNMRAVQIAEAIRAVKKGEASIEPKMVAQLLTEFSRLKSVTINREYLLDQLSTRELEVLKLLAQDLSNREISERLFISENTVKRHIHRALVKLGKKNRRELARLVRSYGVTENQQELP